MASMDGINARVSGLHLVDGVGPGASLSTPSTLESLPNEILDNILGYLALNIDQLSNIRAHLIEAKGKGAQPLFNMCLVSRRFYSVANPHLYRGIRLQTVEDMTLFFRSLEEKPETGQMVEYLDCDVRLTDLEVVSELQETFNSRYVGRGNRPNHVDFDKFPALASFPQMTEEYEEDVMTQAVLFALLCLVPNLHCLVLVMGNPWYLNTCIYDILDPPPEDSTEEDATPPHHPPFLPNFTTLLVKPERSSGIIVEYALPLLLATPSLRRFEMAGDDSCWREMVIEPPPAIEHVTLVESACTPSDLYDVCRLFPRLRSLDVDVDEDCGTGMLYPVLDSAWVDGKWQAIEEGLEAGLLLRRDTLERIELRLNYRPSVWPLIGPHRMVTKASLAQMKNLVSCVILPKWYLEQ